MLRAYKYRIYPTEEQAAMINKTIGCARFIYNWALDKSRKDEYKKLIKNTKGKEKRLIDWNKISAEIKDLRENMKDDSGNKWLKEVESMPLFQSLQDLQTAYKNFFGRIKKGIPVKDAGEPNFKTKNSLKQSYRTYESTHARKYIDWQNNTVSLPKIKMPIKIKLHRHFEGNIRYLTASRTSFGEYYVSFTVDTPQQKMPVSAIEPESTIGVDLGMKKHIALSDGRLIEEPACLSKYEKKLERLSRVLARRRGNSKGEKKSRRFLKQKLKVTKLHEKIMRVHQDFLHNLTYKLTHESRTKTICVEDLNTKAMNVNSMALKHASFCPWGNAVNMLNYKCDWYGVNTIHVDNPDQDGGNINTSDERNDNLSVKIKNAGLKKQNK